MSMPLNVTSPATPAPVPVEIASYPAGLPQTLKDIFNLSLIEFCMLSECVRDNAIKFGCDARLNAPYRDVFWTLREKGLIYFAERSGTWELTTLGHTVLKAVALLCHAEKPAQRERAKVLFFPVRQAPDTYLTEH